MGFGNCRVQGPGRIWLQPRVTATSTAGPPSLKPWRSHASRRLEMLQGAPHPPPQSAESSRWSCVFGVLFKHSNTRSSPHSAGSSLRNAWQRKQCPRLERVWRRAFGLKWGLGASLVLLWFVGGLRKDMWPNPLPAAHVCNFQEPSTY